jgi:uncharacterized membrane protein YecN with MAPEG domain
MLPITSLFAAFFAIYFVRLALAVIKLRRSNKVALGTGGVSELEGAIRAHGNFAEYVPLGLILLGLLESYHFSTALVAALGLFLMMGRILHARALSRANLKLRVRGMVITFGTLNILALANLVLAARAIIG